MIGQEVLLVETLVRELLQLAANFLQGLGGEEGVPLGHRRLGCVENVVQGGQVHVVIPHGRVEATPVLQLRSQPSHAHGAARQIQRSRSRCRTLVVILGLEGAPQLADTPPLAHRLLAGLLALPVVAEIIRGNGARALEQRGTESGQGGQRRGVDRLGHLLATLMAGGESAKEVEKKQEQMWLVSGPIG